MSNYFDAPKMKLRILIQKKDDQLFLTLIFEQRVEKRDRTRDPKTFRMFEE